jgi:protein-disulfide isomerase
MLPALLAGCGGNTLLPPTTELTPDKVPDTGSAYPSAEDTASTGPERFNPFADPSAKPAGGREVIENPTPADIMVTGTLPEFALGRPDAPVTIVEYASLSCPHCRNFHLTTFPQFKKQYIDTGKVRFIMREFPLDNLAAGASMLARCAGGDKTFPLIGALFHTQETWAFVRGDPRPELFKVAKQAGFTQESFDKCLADQKLLDDITALRTRGADTFGVSSTPTFFINGKKLAGASLDDFEKAFAPILKS